VDRSALDVAVLVKRILTRLLPRLHDFSDGHYFGADGLVIPVVDYTVGGPNLLVVHVLKGLLVVGYFAPTANQLIFERIAFIDDLGDDIPHLGAHLAKHGHCAEVAALERQILPVGDEVALLLRRVESLQNHVQHGVGDTVLGTDSQHRPLILIHRGLKDQPCGFERVCRAIIRRKVEFAVLLKPSDLRQNEVNGFLFDGQRLAFRLLVGHWCSP